MPIGTLTETDLHAALKRHYALPGDVLEAPVEGYFIDILRGEKTLLEVQTHNFGACRQKLRRLAQDYTVRLIHPIAQDKWLVQQKTPTGAVVNRRKSPKHGRWEDVFVELVSCPDLLLLPNFTLEVVLIHEEEIRCPNTGRKRGRWQKAWRTCNRRLLKVLASHVFTSPADLLACLPTTLPKPFTNAHLAEAQHLPPYLAQKMTYCLRQMGVIEVVGKVGRALAYEQVNKEARKI